MRAPHPTTVFLLLSVLVSAASARADEPGAVEIIEGPVPSAEELGRILYPESRTTEISTRGIGRRGIVVTPDAPAAEAANRPRSFGLLIQFAFDSSEILPASRPYLDQVGRMLQLENLAGRRLIIEGHTDASGSAAYNQRLSEKRARAIRSYLVSSLGVEPGRLVALGKGESRLLEGRDPLDARNRRVEFRSAE